MKEQQNQIEQLKKQNANLMDKHQIMEDKMESLIKQVNQLYLLTTAEAEK